MNYLIVILIALFILYFIYNIYKDIKKQKYKKKFKEACEQIKKNIIKNNKIIFDLRQKRNKKYFEDLNKIKLEEKKALDKIDQKTKNQLRDI